MTEKLYRVSAKEKGPQLGKLALSRKERSMLEGWGLRAPYIGKVGSNYDNEPVYFWHGDPLITDEVPILAVKPTLNVVTVNQPWCFGVVTVETLRLPSTEECIAAAEYPAFDDGSARSLLHIAIEQLGSWVAPHTSEDRSEVPNMHYV